MIIPEVMEDIKKNWVNEGGINRFNQQNLVTDYSIKKK